MKFLVVPFLLIMLGVGWLLTTLGVVPEVDWVWTLGLALIGVLAFVLGGFDKVTFVCGTFFLLASCLSVLRQTGRLRMDIEIPVLVIAAGVLMLVAAYPGIPLPQWLIDSKNESNMGH